MIFDWYTNDDPDVRMGANKIANELNNYSKSPKGIDWKGSTVLFILKNAVYAGRIQWKKKKATKSIIAGKKKDVKTRPVEEWIDVVLENAVYRKEKNQRDDNFTLVLYPKLPQIIN